MSITFEKTTSILYPNAECAHCGVIITDPEFYLVTREDGEIQFYEEDCFDEAFFTCEECGEIFLKDDEECFETDTGFICESCKDDYGYTQCEDCGKYFRYINTAYKRYHYRKEEVYVCDDCLSERYFKCDCCGEWFNGEDFDSNTVEVGDGTEEWCDACVCDHAVNCYDCGRLISDNIAHWSERYEEYYCEDCYPSDCIHEYDYKPDPYFYEVGRSSWYPDGDTVYLGFELEVEGHNRKACDEYASIVEDTTEYTYIKHDGSLTDGMEIVSHPATLEYHMSMKPVWSDIFRRMRSNGFTSHDNGHCGLHVHLSLEAIEKKNPFAIHNLLLLVDKHWDNLYKFSRRTREQLHWTKRYNTEDRDYEFLKSDCENWCGRYMAVNLKNDETIEIRLWRGTLNLETFYASLQLSKVLIDKAISLGSNADAVRSTTWKELVKSDYEELNAYLARRGLLENTSVTEVESIEDVAAGC